MCNIYTVLIIFYITYKHKNFHMTTTKKSAQIKTIDDQGQLENDFVTNVAPKFDRDSGELTIIHVEQL